jgi:hypothetical protein
MLLAMHRPSPVKLTRKWARERKGEREEESEREREKERKCVYIMRNWMRY